MLTVRDLLSDLDVRLVTGDAGLDLPVRWVHISELRDPTPWLSGGELLLTTGMGLQDDAGVRAYVDRLAEHALAGLGFGPGFDHDEVPDALLAAARARGFPVFAVPYELPFLAVTERAFAQLVNEQYAILRRSIAALERLQRIVLSEDGLEAIAGALSALIGGAALVFDGRGELLASHTFRRELDDDVGAAVAREIHDRARNGDGRAYAPHHPELAGRALALPIASAPAAKRATPQAWLVAVQDAGCLVDFARLLLDPAGA